MTKWPTTRAPRRALSRRHGVGGWAFALAILVPCIALAGNPDPGFPTGPPVPYRLTNDSSLVHESATVEGTASIHEAVLSGTFALVPLFGPLDWDNYALETVRLQSADAAGVPFALCGDGFYSVGGRLTFTKEMELILRVEGKVLQFEGGPDPVDPFWPMIDMTVTGSREVSGRTDTWTLRIVAVPEYRRVRYRLIDGSRLLDDCEVCRRPAILEPMRGGFDLSLMETDPLTVRHRIFEMEMGTADGGYRLAGEGTYETIGDFVLQQTMSLDLDVDGPAGRQTKTFENGFEIVDLPWPLLQAELAETEGTPMSTLRLFLRAAPFREAWFSTNSGFTPVAGIGKDPPVTAGDILSDVGHLVAANRHLLRNLGLEPGTAGLAVDALDIAAGAETLFSLDEDIFSGSLGPLQHGDLLSDRGRIVQRNQDLTKAFGFMPPAPNVGLDAIHGVDEDQVYFSIERSIFSENLGRTLLPGDLLTTSGVVHRTNAELLARFHPEVPDHDYGLDALFVWPDGEIWFSTEEGFRDLVLGPIGDGDLMSDRGIILIRNRDLVGGFEPAEDLDDFGADALFVVTDLLPVAPPGRILRIVRETADAGLRVEWDGTGRVFQVERSDHPCSPFDVLSPILPMVQWTDSEAPGARPAAVYRVRQW